jgi:hypothetical protein
VKLAVVEGRQEGSEAEETAEGDDVDEIEGPAVFFKEAAEMLAKGLMLDVRRLLGSPG